MKGERLIAGGEQRGAGAEGRRQKAWSWFHSKSKVDSLSDEEEGADCTLILGRKV